jgi:uncharacterized membrane protein
MHSPARADSPPECARVAEHAAAAIMMWIAPVVAALIGTAVESRGGNRDVGRAERRYAMQEASMSSSDAHTIGASVTIHRSVAEVYEFYRDFRNLPRFLGDVMAVEPAGPATTRWSIQGPLGIRIRWTIRVTEERLNELIRYETVTAPALRTYWTIHFAPGPAADMAAVREVMQAPLGRFGRAALALVGKHPAEEVVSNLHRLKELLETGVVTDTSYAVAGKFAQHADGHERRR